MTRKQVEFLCYEGREGLYGGAAGGGKSVAILAAALQWIEEPGANSLILRRTYKQLSKSDSILNKSKEWLRTCKDKYGNVARWSGDEKKWTFPNGNTLEFGHMEHEDSKFDYQGGIWAYVGVDEATQFTESMLAFPRSRQRRPAGARYPLRWRGASNPGGIGHACVKARYIKDAEGNNPSTPNRQFFPAKLSDNPNIDRDEYVTGLLESGIDKITLAQMLEGDWDAVAGGRFKRDWFQDWSWRGDYIGLHKPDGIHEFIHHKVMKFLTVDPAASTSQKADYTVISAWCVSPWGDLVWLDCARVKREIPEIVPEIQKMWSKWRPAWAGIEAIASNRAVYQLACRALNPTIIARPLDKGATDKLVHATPAIVLASAMRLYLPRRVVGMSFPREDVEAELVRFTGDDKLDDHDDIVDTVSYAVQHMDGIPKTGDMIPSVVSTIF